MGWELRQGRWQDVLADVECDTLICDPPYSDRTHGGYDKAASDWERLGQAANIGYAALVEDDAVDFLRSWLPRVRRWAVIFGDDVTQRWWQDHIRATKDWVCFPPVVWFKRWAQPRLSGDGPTNCCEWMTIARRRGIDRPGSLPGFYEVRQVQEKVGVVGSKNLLGMRAVVRDYSRPGDLICDPFGGGGTTLLAAEHEGRQSIGSERDPDTYQIAHKRLSTAKFYARPLFADEPARVQGSLLEE
jgi:site-specific DNA-methyltransferase (adenine-specific)